MSGPEPATRRQIMSIRARTAKEVLVATPTPIAVLVKLANERLPENARVTNKILGSILSRLTSVGAATRTVHLWRPGTPHETLYADGPFPIPSMYKDAPDPVWPRKDGKFVLCDDLLVTAAALAVPASMKLKPTTVHMMKDDPQ